MAGRLRTVAGKGYEKSWPFLFRVVYIFYYRINYIGGTIMDKFKFTIKVLLYLLMAFISIPIVILTLLGGAIIYGTLKVENSIIGDIQDDTLTDMWNKFVGMFSETINLFSDLVKMEMELY